MNDSYLVEDSSVLIGHPSALHVSDLLFGGCDLLPCGWATNKGMLFAYRLNNS